MNDSQKITKAVIYTRVSTDDQAENGTSLTTQLEACRNKAAQLNAAIVCEYEDAGISGGLFLTRPGIQAALKEIEEGNANALIVSNITRLSRDVEHQAMIKRIVQFAEAKLVFCDSDLGDSPMDDFMYHVQGGFAQLERAIIKERTTKGRRRRAEEGIQPCRSMRPYGYHIVNKGDVMTGANTLADLGTYQVIEEEAKWARGMFARYDAGDSLRKVCQWLNESEVSTPRNGKYWRMSTLKRILNNPVYKGKAVFGRHKRKNDESRIQQGFINSYTIRETAEDQWVYMDAPALVDDRTWEKCQARLKDNNKLLGGNPSRKHMLSGLIKCSKCRRNMSAQKRMKKRSPRQIASGSGSKPYQSHQYFCRDARASRNTGGEVCNSKHYNAQKVEDLVIKAIQDTARTPEALEAALRAFQQTQAGMYSEAEYKAVSSELGKLSKKESATVQAQIKGIELGANVAIYEQMLCDISAKRQGLQKRFDQLKEDRSKAKSAMPEETTEIISNMLSAVDKSLAAGSEEITAAQKQELLARVVESVYPQDDEVVVTLKPLTDAQTDANIKILWPPAAATSRARLTLS